MKGELPSSDTDSKTPPTSGGKKEEEKKGKEKEERIEGFGLNPQLEA